MGDDSTNPSTQGKRARAAELLRLARAEFGRLLPGEVKMLRAAAMGEACDLATDVERLGRDPDVILQWDSRTEEGSEWGCWEHWGSHRTVRAAVLRWLCAARKPKELVDPFGLFLLNARIEEELDLDGTRIPFSIWLFGCALPAGLSLRNAHTQTLSLQGSCTDSISADGLTTKGGVFLRYGFRARGMIRLLGATIGGDLSCTDAHFDCARKKDGNPVGEPYALSADRLTTTGDVFLSGGFRARGQVRLLGASIGGNLDCDNADFDCARKKDGNPVGEPYALTADGLTTTGGVFLSGGFRARGQVRLLGVSIGGDLDCSDAHFDCARDNDGNPVGKPYALSADVLTTTGGVFLSGGFRARGMVRLLGASIGGNLACVGAHFDCARKKDGDPVGEPYSLFAQGMEVKGATQLRNARWTSDNDDHTPAIVNFDRARLGYLVDEADTRPGLMLDDCRYDAIRADSPLDATHRLKWLERHDETVKPDRPPGFFDPQPYRQLAGVLRQQGHAHDADEIMVVAMRKQAKGNFTRRWNTMDPVGDTKWRNELFAVWNGVWSWLFGRVSGYGYRRWQPLWCMFAFILIGAAVFWAGARMTPTQARAVDKWHTNLEFGAPPKAGWMVDYP